MTLSLRKLSVATPVPVLDLQFWNQVLDSRISFARASSGTYFTAAGILGTASTDVPRFSSPGPAGGQTGWLLEGAATNLALYARDLTQVNWVVSALSSVALDQTGIDGSANTASSFTAGAANATVLQTPGLSSVSRTYSVYLKRITGTGTISITPDGTTFTTVVLTSSWQRFSVTATVIPIIGIKIATSGDKIAVDYNQLETGAFASSPILTTVATATRAAETATMPSAGIIVGQLPLTAQLDWSPETTANAVGMMAVSLDDSTLTNRIIFQQTLTATHVPTANMVSTGVAASFNGPTANVAGTLVRSALKGGPNFAVAAFNGALPTATALMGTPIVPPGINTIRFGQTSSGTLIFYGQYFRLRIWRSALPTAVEASNSFGGN